MAELREEIGVRERESRQEKNGRVEGGGWCESQLSGRSWLIREWRVEEEEEDRNRDGRTA